MPSQHVSSPGPARHSRTLEEMTHAARITRAFVAFGGIDWADATHDGVSRLRAPHSARASRSRHARSPRGVGHTLRTRCNGHPMAVCLALHNGPLVSALRTAALLVLLPLHPLPLARYRAACPPSRATDAPTAAARQRDGSSPIARSSSRSSHSAPHARARPTRRPPPPRRQRYRPDHPPPHTHPTASCPQVLHWCQDKAPPCSVTVCAAGPPSRPHHAPDAPRWQPAAATTMCARRTSSHRASTPSRRPSPGPRMRALSRPMPCSSRPGAPNSGSPVEALATCETRHRAARAEPARFPPVPGTPRSGARRRRPAARRLWRTTGTRGRRRRSAKIGGERPGTARRGKQAWGPWRLQCPTCLRQTCVAWAAASIRHACWARVSSQPPRAQGTAPRPPCARWPARGSVSSCGVGRIVPPMTRPPISMRSTVGLLPDPQSVRRGPETP